MFCFYYIWKRWKKQGFFLSLAVLHPFRVLRWPHPYKWSKISSTHTSIMSQRSRSQMENITKYVNFQNSSWLHRNRESLCVRVTMSHWCRSTKGQRNDCRKWKYGVMMFGYDWAGMLLGHHGAKCVIEMWDYHCQVQRGHRYHPNTMQQLTAC